MSDKAVQTRGLSLLCVKYHLTHHLLELVYLCCEEIKSLAIFIFLEFERFILLLEGMNELFILSPHSFLLHAFHSLGLEVPFDMVELLVSDHQLLLHPVKLSHQINYFLVFD